MKVCRQCQHPRKLLTDVPSCPFHHHGISACIINSINILTCITAAFPPSPPQQSAGSNWNTVQRCPVVWWWRKFKAQMCFTVWTFNTSHRFRQLWIYNPLYISYAWAGTQRVVVCIQLHNQSTSLCPRGDRELLFCASNVWFASSKQMPEVVKRYFWMGTPPSAEYCAVKEESLLPEP